ncbi:MAG: VOC family protein [Pseudomonadota bacterium]
MSTAHTAAQTTPQTPPLSAVTWFELPARDLDRAQRFYETLLQVRLRRESMGPVRTLAVFPYAAPGVGGCLMNAPDLAPAADGGGALVYLDTGRAGLDAALARLPSAGGRQLGPKVTLPAGMGEFAHIEDSEGNRVGLHADA